MREDCTLPGDWWKKAGALAMIAMNEEFDGFNTIADLHVLPTTHVSYSAGLRIKAYINSASKPTATISFRGTVIGQPSSAPRVLSFSSRGPNLAESRDSQTWHSRTRWQHSILMAIPRGQHHQSKFIFSCQHRYFKGFSSLEWHCSFAQELAPRLVTCLHQVHDHDNSRCKEAKRNANSRSHFSSGQPICQRLRPCQPCERKRPGLVYDIQPDDYVPYLCGLKYIDNEIQVITQIKTEVLESEEHS